MILEANFLRSPEKSVRLSLSATFLLFLTLLSCQDDKAPYIHLEGKAQGTTFNITYRDSLNRDFSKPVDSLFRVIDKSMSLWDTTSIITGFNKNLPNIQADIHFTKVFNRSQEVSVQTSGAFDITVGPLVKAWGFSIKKGLPPPTSKQVDSLHQLLGFERVKLQNGKLLKPDARMEIDFNAIAQGYTVDVMADFLVANGIRHFLVEIGGEVRAQGQNEAHQTWRVGIDKPIENKENERPLQIVVSLNGKSLATSGSYRKFVIRDGKKYSHAIDPKTGYPITHNLLSVSVIADDCMTADAFATAFMIMGVEESIKFAQANHLEVYCMYEDDKGKMQIKTTRGFDKFVVVEK